MYVEALATVEEELALARACAAGTSSALAEFGRRYLAWVEPQLVRAGFTAEVAEEARQRVAERLLVAAPGSVPRIATFRGGCRLRAWVRVSAVREALHVLRGMRPEVALEDVVCELSADDAGPELRLLKESYRREFASSVAQSLAALSPRERLILRQYFLDRLSIDELARLHRVHRATTARWVAGARGKLVSLTRAALLEKLQLSEADAGRLMRWVRSGVSLSLSRHLAASETADASGPRAPAARAATEAR